MARSRPPRRAAALLLVLAAGCSLPRYPDLPWKASFPLPDARATLAALKDPGGPPLVVAHRGGRAWAPENTIQGVLAAWRMGVPMVEADVRTTSDGVPVLLHDSSLRRTTGTGKEVRDIPLSEVKKAGIPFKEGRPDLHVPTLAEALRAARGKVVLVLDLKRVEVGRLLETLEREKALGEVLVLLHDRKQMEELRRDPRRRKILIAVRVRDASQALAYQEEFHPAVVHVSPEFLSPRLSQALRKGGSRVWVNAFNGPDKTGRVEDYLALLRKGAGLIQTDRPLLALRAMAALPAGAGPGD